MALLRRISTLCRALLHHAVAGIEWQNPEALLELERENLRRLMAQYNQGLASHAGLAERLMSRTRALEHEEVQLRARTAVQVRVGSREDAGRAALQLQTVRRELASSREQLAQAEATYDSLKKTRDIAIDSARAKIESVRRVIGDLRTHQATAALNEMAAGLMATVDGSSGTLERLHEMVEEQRDRAAGRARVARDSLGLDDPRAAESEQAACAAALDEYLAQDGGLVVEVPQHPGAASAQGPTWSTKPSARTRLPGDPANIPFMPIDMVLRDE